ncbi:tetraacyldisaccharide 4'-kinase [Roseibium sp.]|uniref:tetraacyldisaccharide 4'-kinase n=1 Tax=Roseibium sp. TaxID=1936156 RepID=UPI003A9773DC
MRNAPAFWWQKGLKWQALALYLPSLIYGRATGARMMRKPSGAARVPVVCVGNFVVGGVGKTPFALRLAKRLAAEGFEPGFLLRGYGGSESGPLVVDADRHDSEQVGDEALMLAKTAPTVVAADRVAGAALAESNYADIIIMDDGFQNPALAKDLTVVLVDAATGLGNGLCLPAGPLRAPMSNQIGKTDVLVVVGQGSAADEVLHLAGRRGLPILHAHVEPDIQEELKGVPLLAFAGIGRPQKFFSTLQDAGLDVAETRSFPDHHAYTVEQAEDMLRRAEAEGYQLVTTAKDMVRLETAQHEIFRWLCARTEVLNVRMKIEDEDRLVAAIREKIRSRAFKPGK